MPRLCSESYGSILGFRGETALGFMDVHRALNYSELQVSERFLPTK